MWEEILWLLDGRKCVYFMEYLDSCVLGLDVFGEVLLFSCVYIGRIVMFCRNIEEQEKEKFDYLVCIWENELLGGMDWILEDILKFDCKFFIDNLQICLEWIFVEDSMYILIVCIGNEVFILGCVLRIVNIIVRGESMLIGKEIWLFFYSVYLILENKWQLLIRVFLWICNGVFVVGLGIEMQVYL